MGSDSFSYVVSDGNGGADTATVNIKVEDTIRPTINSVTPTAGSTGVGPGANITAIFSEKMKASTVNGTTVRLVKKGAMAKLPAVVSYDSTSKKVTLNPKYNLKRGARYTATITIGAKDLAGNPLAKSKVWSFTVKP